MALPHVNGWLIDFRTARAVFSGRANLLIQTLVSMCQNGNLKYCHCEHDDFKANDILKPPFIDDQDCRLIPCGQVMQTSMAIVGGTYGKPLLRSDNLTLFLVSSALVNKFGIISDLTNSSFSMAADIGPSLGLHVMTAQQFQAAI